jgi:hypothetical protein
LNYTSGKATNGADSHNHTIIWGTHFKNANLNLVQNADVQPAIPESSYYLNNVGWQAYTNKDTTGINNNAVCTFAAERQSGEGVGSGFVELGTFVGYSDLESGVCQFSSSDGGNFKKHPSDPNSNRLDIEASRTWSLKTFKHVCGAMLYITYHSITYTVSGAITGYTGNGSGIPVYIYRADTKELVHSATTSTGGSYSVTWYDNTVNLFAESRQDSTHTGRSDDGTAS